MIRAEEEALIRTLLGTTKDAGSFLPQLAEVLVRELEDGEMGSLEFIGDGERRLGRALVEAEYVDSDGIPVSIVLNVDQHGQLLEFDMWKVDFSPLQRYPAPECVRIL